MIKLLGTDACTSCRQAKTILERNGIVYRWVDVSKKPGFKGNLPQLLVDGKTIFGLGEITKYARKLVMG